VKPVRLDTLLVKEGVALTRTHARELIEAGSVLVDGMVADRPSRQVMPSQKVALVKDEDGWVSRGALKLIGALADLDVAVEGHTCADLGSSTGGFTQVLLTRGARRVFAVDVGRGQLAWSLRMDERVAVMEGVNARYLDALPEPVTRIVGDLSFISLALILPSVARLLAVGGEAVLLVKPQFEAHRDAIAPGGKVRSEHERLAAIEGVRAQAIAAGFEVIGGHDCRLPGAKAGNVEYFLHLRRCDPTR